MDSTNKYKKLLGDTRDPAWRGGIVPASPRSSNDGPTTERTAGSVAEDAPAKNFGAIPKIIAVEELPSTLGSGLAAAILRLFSVEEKTGRNR